jgi:hypothetical protein
LLPGRAEFIEKYFEVVRELKNRGFAVVTFDWRWQGLSGRVLADRQKGYVENFRQYDTDRRPSSRKSCCHTALGRSSVWRIQWAARFCCAPLWADTVISIA